MAVTAMNARDRFGSMLHSGSDGTCGGSELLINVSVVTNTIPPTGVPDAICQLWRKFDNFHSDGDGDGDVRIQRNFV